MDITRYLRRIRYSGELVPSRKTLRDLHVAHLRTVPFENLDIHLGRAISLEPDALFEKIVVRERGGFCYELNGLFATLLGELGFGVKHLSASDAHEDGSYGPEFDHLVLEVQTPGTVEPFLVDVGWGDTFVEPLRLDEDAEHEQGGRGYQLVGDGAGCTLWQRDYDGRRERQYRFTRQPRALTDFREMCHYHQSSPDSIFVRKRICTLATPEGRITLDDARFIVTEGGVRHEQPVEDAALYRQLLSDRFGVKV